MPSVVTIAMVDKKKCTVNTQNDLKKEEIMIPYSRVLYVAWDKDTGSRLKKIRNDRDLSQVALAKLANGVISLDSIKSLEVGRVDSVSREKLDTLLKILGTDVRSLFPTVAVRNF